MSAQQEAPIVAEPRVERSRPRPVASWRDHHAWSAGASLRRLMSRPVGTLLTVAVMALALALPLTFYLLLGNVQKMGQALGQNQAVSVFMQPGQTGPAVEMMATKLRERADVASVAIKSPQQGMDELARMQGFSGALNTLDSNPLPYALEVLPKPEASADDVARLVTDLRALQGVDLVQDSGTWRQRLDALLGVGNRVVLILAALLALAVLLVVGNTVRLDIQSRREEIEVLQHLGATDGFIRRRQQPPGDLVPRSGRHVHIADGRGCLRLERPGVQLKPFPQSIDRRQRKLRFPCRRKQLAGVVEQGILQRRIALGFRLHLQHFFRQLHLLLRRRGSAPFVPKDID